MWQSVMTKRQLRLRNRSWSALERKPGIMKIKAIVTDMDGTFLNEQHEYNRERFAKQYAEMKVRGIEFVVASGRQYYGLLPHFRDISEEITFIADNGTQIYHQGQEVYVEKMPREKVARFIGRLLEAGFGDYCISGRKGSYVNRAHMTEEKIEFMQNFADNIQMINSLDEVDDDLLKFGVSLENAEQEELLRQIIKEADGEFEAIGSGYSFIDVISPGVSKGTALRKLQKAYGYGDDEVVVFGDSENDISMLTGKKYSFAMQNASAEVKKCANYCAPHNEEEGVLEIIDHILAGSEEFAGTDGLGISA